MHSCFLGFKIFLFFYEYLSIFHWKYSNNFVFSSSFELFFKTSVFTRMVLTRLKPLVKTVVPKTCQPWTNLNIWPLSPLISICLFEVFNGHTKIPLITFSSLRSWWYEPIQKIQGWVASTTDKQAHVDLADPKTESCRIPR